MMLYVYSTLILAASSLSVRAVLVSPCPDVFQYQTSPELPDRWIGILDLGLPDDYSIITSRILIGLDRKADIFGTGGIEEISTENSQEFFIEKTDVNFPVNPKAKEAHNLEIVASFDYAQPIPLIQFIRLNGREICRTIPETKNKPNFPTLPELPTGLLLAKLNATGYVPDSFMIIKN